MNSGTAFQKAYLPLDFPFNQNPYGLDSGISALNDLYPGRPMTIFGRYYEINEIPNENPEGARETYLKNKEETKAYAKHLQNLALAQSGGDRGKVLVHAIDDPSSVIDNPSLQGNAMQSPPAEAPYKVPPIVETSPSRVPFSDLDAKDDPGVESVNPFQSQGNTLIERYGSEAPEGVTSESKGATSSNTQINTLMISLMILILVVVLCVAFIK